MEPTLKLWGRATSYNVQKVAWIIAELGLPCVRIDAGGAFGGLNDPEYVALNPNKRVPTLIDSDHVLWESNAICRYLVDAYATPTNLKGQTTQARAQADMWMEWFQNNLYTNSIAIFYQIVRLPPRQRSIEKRDDILQSLNTALTIFDARLKDQKFILGDRLSLGDIPTGAFLFRYFTMDIERPPFPHLERYYDDLKERSAYQETVMVDYSSLRGLD